MRAVVQRVSRAEVRVEGRPLGRIAGGLVVLVGIGRDDSYEAGEWLAEKIVNLRVFDDDTGKMNRSMLEAAGAVLCISQFTLYGDCRKGRRPSYDRAAPPEAARVLYDSFVAALRSHGVRVETGGFWLRGRARLPQPVH